MSSAAAAALCLVPVVGGLALICGGTAALYVDHRNLVADRHAARPIWIRYTSLATMDLHEQPHWIFLVSVCIFSVCLVTTGMWQAQLFQDDNKQRDVRLFSQITAGCGLVTAASPMGTVTGTVVHTLAAAGFSIFGFQWSHRVWELAGTDYRNQVGLETVRLIFITIGSAGSLLMIGMIYLGVTATARIGEHEQALQDLERLKETQIVVDEDCDEAGERTSAISSPTTNQDPSNKDHQDEQHTQIESKILTEQQLRSNRLMETLLSIGQISAGVMMGGILISAAAEVTDESIDTSEAMEPALISTAVVVVVFAGFVMTNNFWYQRCQAKWFQPNQESMTNTTLQNQENNDANGSS